MLYVHRVLHPVGEGAFFTEQFYDEKKKCVFSVVYDCGIYNNEAEIIDPQINSAFPGKKGIDLMFISHFDDDHVNGIEKLIKAKKLTNKSKAFIPFIIPLEDLYKLDVKSKKQLENYTTIFNILKRNHVKIIPVAPNRVPYNDYPYKDDENVGIFQISSSTIKLDHIYWIYIPFYVSEDYYNAFEKGIRNHNDKENQGNKIEIEKLYDPEEVQKHIDKLKPIYQNLGKSACGVTKINVNSLLVLSKAKSPEMVKSVMFIGGKLPVLPLAFSIHPRFPYHRIYNESCLYTGDCALKSKKRWTKLIQQLKDCYISEIGLFQIPHHGSPNNYNKAIPNNNAFTIDVGFINCCLTKGNAHFEYKIIEDFWGNCKPLFLVTEDPVSKIHFVISIDESAASSDDNITTE